MLWPLGQVQRTVQPVIALVADTVTVAPKPPLHSLVLAYAAVQAPLPGGGLEGGGLDGGGLEGGGLDGGGLDGGGVLVPPPKMTSLHR